MIGKVAEHFKSTTISSDDHHYGQMVLKGCHGVLVDLYCLFEKYRRLASINKRIVLNSIKLGKENITTLHVQLISNAVLLKGFVRRCVVHFITTSLILWILIFISSCEYMEVQAQVAALLGLQGTANSGISVASIASFAADTNLETASKQFYQDLDQIGATEDMIRRNEDKIIEILKSQGMVTSSPIHDSNIGDQAQALETAYKEFCEELYRIGVTEDMLPPKSKILRVLRSRGIGASSQRDGRNTGDKGQLGLPFLLLMHMICPATNSQTGNHSNTKAMPSFRLSSRVTWFEPSSGAGPLMPGGTGKDGFAPLHLPAGNSHMGIAEVLFGKSSSTKILAQDDTTPLHLAAGGGYIGLVELLLGNTPKNSLKDHTGVIGPLFGKVSVEALDKDENTALHPAAQGGHTAIVDLLLRNGASIEALDKDRRTVLHLSAQEGHTAAVDLLLGKGATIEAPDNLKSTALHPAAFCGHTGAVELLLKKGASIGAKRQGGSTPFHLAAAKGHTGIVGLFLREGASIEAQGEAGYTPLHEAAYRGGTGTVELLLEKGASVEALTLGHNTPLHLAAREGHTGVAKLLLGKGASFEAVDSSNMTPLNWAASRGHTDMVKLLEKKAAELGAGRQSFKMWGR